MRKSGPSTYDVARHAHVSVSTVSRVINGQRGVDQHTRAAVWRSIDHLGYEVVRNPEVLSHVLVLVPSVTFQSTPWQRMISGMLEEASHHGLPVMFAPACTVDQAREEIRTASVREGVIGVVQAGLPSILIEQSALPDTHKVATVSMLMPNRGHRVNIDMYDALRHATQRLIAIGHRQIALAIDELAWWGQQQRLQGYLDAFAANGLPAPNCWCEVPVSGVTAWLIEQMADPDGPTAIIAGTSQLSRRLFADLYRLQIAIPKELSFIGIGHVQPEAAPLFDTIVQPTFALGAEVVRLLRQIVTRPGDIVDRWLPAELQQVGTIGPPRRTRDRPASLPTV